MTRGRGILCCLLANGLGSSAYVAMKFSADGLLGFAMPGLRPPTLGGVADWLGLGVLSWGPDSVTALVATLYLAIACSFLGTLFWNMGLSSVRSPPTPAVSTQEPST